jgi:hypothetical protein
MKIPKPTDQEQQRFRTLVPDDPRVTIRPMFANLGAYVNGNMFAGTYGPDIGVKLSDSDRAELLAWGGAPFGPAERPMSGYLTIPPGDDSTIAEWLGRGLDHIATLPPKRPAPKRR